MKNIFSLLFIFLIVASCTVNKQPEFLGIEKIDVVNSDLKSLSIEATALFKNRNDLGGTLDVDQIEVYIDSAYVATVTSETFTVPRQDSFSVPLRVNFPTSKIFENIGSNLLGAIINQVLNKKVEVTMKGTITYKLAGFSFDYPIDHKEELLLD